MKYSTRSTNPLGLMEKEIKERTAKSEPAGKKYRPRRRSELSSAEIFDIVHEYLVKNMMQAEVAKKYRVRPALVSKLVNEAKKQPQKLRDLKQK